MNFIYRWLYDKRTSRVEKESTAGSNSTRETGAGSTSRTQVSDGCVVSPSDEVQIPDPWL